MNKEREKKNFRNMRMFIFLKIITAGWQMSTVGLLHRRLFDDSEECFQYLNNELTPDKWLQPEVPIYCTKISG